MFHPLPGLVWTQLASWPAGAFGLNQTVTDPSAFFFTQARYRIPIEPLLIVLAALGAQSAFPRLSRFLAGDGAGSVPPKA